MSVTVQACAVIGNAASPDDEPLTCNDANFFLLSPFLVRALAEVRDRCASEREFLADFDDSGRVPDGLAACLQNDPEFAASLDWVDRREADVSETDIEIYYLMHRDTFQCPEVRSLRHILVTIGTSPEGDDRASARRKIDNVRARLLKSPQRFAELAARHSECATAANGGSLGDIRHGQLHPALEKAAFSLGVGELSRVVESPQGFHVIQCLSVESASDQPLMSVHEQIRALLVESRRHAARREWIASLFRACKK